MLKCIHVNFRYLLCVRTVCGEHCVVVQHELVDCDICGRIVRLPGLQAHQRIHRVAAEMKEASVNKSSQLLGGEGTSENTSIQKNGGRGSRAAAVR